MNMEVTTFVIHVQYSACVIEDKKSGFASAYTHVQCTVKTIPCRSMDFGAI
jgi:hypothetical protein